MPKAGTVDSYIAGFPPDVRAKLETMRRTISGVVPEAEESISYGIPVFELRGRYVVYIAGWKKHLSMYPIPDVEAELEREIAPYRAGRGTLRFRLDEPVPVELVERVVTLLVKQASQRGQ